MLFRNREDAGKQLAREVLRFRSERPVVLGLPRGGVAVAYEVARALGAPLDIWVARKLGAPSHPELGVGAIAEGGEVFLDKRRVASVGASREEMQAVAAEEARELERRVQRYRGGRPPPDVRDRTVILVDDGIATGGTARAALRAIRRGGARKVILAAPVAATDTVQSLRREADEIVCVRVADDLGAVGYFYADFGQVPDAEVGAFLRKSRAPGEPSFDPPATAPEPSERDVVVLAGGENLAGTLALPAGAAGLVLFAHGSGSGRLSPRNRAVAETLRTAGMGTLLFDLLTPEEQREEQWSRHLRFDIELLARRLTGATDWLRSQAGTARLPIGYFGASTGAAAALVAASERADVVRAVVSRGGRPDLATWRLPLVQAATLLIVGSRDAHVLGLNQRAYEALRCRKHLAVVPGATHLFEEAGALEHVSRLAAHWFHAHLTRSTIRAAS